MSRRALLYVAAAAALFLIGLAVMLRSSEPTPTASVPVETAPPATAPTATVTAAPTATGQERVGFAIVVENGTAADGIQRVTVAKGDTVTVEVSGAPDEELHVHGYDETLDLGPDGAGTLAFEATLQGVFELELEHAGVQVGELTVE